MRKLISLSLLFFVVPVVAQQRLIERSNPLTKRSNPVGWHTETVHFDSQGWWDRLWHGKKEIATVSVPAIKCERQAPMVYRLEVWNYDADHVKEQQPYVVLDIWGYAGTVSKEAIRKPKDKGIDITALPGRTVFVTWGCPLG